MQRLDDDARLMLRYRDGDYAAFALLYARHKGPLYRYLLRMVRHGAAASDLFQEVWSRLIAMRARYEPRAKFTTLLFHIAHNCAVDFLRRGSSARDALGAPTDLHAGSAEAPEHQRPDRLAEFGEQQHALLAALAALPHEQRETFLLHEETGLTIEEIARVTAVPLETAKSRLRYAVRKLKVALAPAAVPRLRLEVRAT